MSAESQRIRAEIQEFYDSWEGGATGAQVVRVLTAYGYNGQYSACMAKKEFEVPWQSVIPSGFVEPDAFQYTRWLRDPNRRTFTASAVLDARNSERAKWHERPISEEEHLAGLACLEDTNEMGDDEADALSYPPGYDEVMSAWQERTIAAVTEVAGSPDDFNRCLADKDLPGMPDGSRDLDSVITHMEGTQPGASDVPRDGEQPGATWRGYVDEETWLLRARWECAQPRYDDAMAQMPSVVAGIQEDFPTEIAALQEHWAQVRSDAEALGWSPDDPYDGWSPEAP